MEGNQPAPDSGARECRFVGTGVVVWFVVFAWSFVSMMVTEATGDGFTRGLNRLEGFFLWQIVALTAAVVLLIYGIGRFRERRGWRWLSRLPILGELALVLFVAGTIVIFSQKQKTEAALHRAEMQEKPVATAVEPVVTITDVDSGPLSGVEPELPPIQTFRGVYRGGFETSEFTLLEPGAEGSWWLEATGENWDALQAHLVERPGRGSSITVILSFTGRRYDGAGFGHLGAFDTRVEVESIEGIRSISEAEFEQVLESIR